MPNYRDAATGHYTTAEDAAARPAETVAETVEAHHATREVSMSDWTTARVVRDRDGDLWFRGCDSDDLWTANTNYPDVFLTTDEVLTVFGPLTPVLDADGLPVVTTVGDLTARHLGKRVQVEQPSIVSEFTVYGIEDRGDGYVYLGAAHFSPSWTTIDTPCEVLA